MNFIKSRFLLTLSLTICWAAFSFKPVWAEDPPITVSDGETKDNLVIGNDGDATTLIVVTGGSARDVEIINGGTATIEGILTIYDKRSTLSEGGKLIVQNGGEAGDVNITGGNVEVNNGRLLYSTVSGEASILVKSDASVEDLIVENSGKLTIYDDPDGATDTNVDNIFVKNGGMIQSKSGEKVTINSLEVEEGGSYNFTTDDTIHDFIVEGPVGSIENGIANNVLVNNGSTLTIKDRGSAYNIYVKTGGKLDVNEPEYDKLGEISVDGVILDGGHLKTYKNSLVNNVTAVYGATADLSDNSLSGDLTLDASAKGFVGNKLFVENTNLDDLIFLNGTNSDFGDIVNSDTSDNHDLYLKNGDYNTTISGWHDINIDNSSVAVLSDIELRNNGTLSLDADSALYVGTTASNNYELTLKGNLSNSGKIDLVSRNGDAGETFVIDGDYNGSGDARLDVNVNVEKAVSDKIIITGKATGTTKVYLSAVDNAMQRNNILFAEAQSQGTAPGEGVFKIWRQAGSIYDWDTIYNSGKWYAQIKKASDGDKLFIVPEMAAYYGLIDNTFMQTSSLGANLRNNIALSEYKKAPCRNVKRGVNAICRSNQPVFSGWFAPASSSITVESPFVYDAEINGFDGGLDLISNGYTKLGLLASYRQGLYNYEEGGEGYQISSSAETNLTSYLAGAYLRHDGQNWSTILAGYAGVIDADISTEDDVSASTSGTTFGATLDVSYIYKNINGLRIEPGVRISYTTVDMDAVEDNGGKTQEFDNASRTEIEAGIRFAKRWDFPDSRAEIFVKPSIVKIMDDSSDFIMDEDISLSQAEDRIVAKISAGLSFDMTSSLSASLSGSYSTGDDYTNTSGNLSVMYRF